MHRVRGVVMAIEEVHSGVEVPLEVFDAARDLADLIDTLIAQEARA